MNPRRDLALVRLEAEPGSRLADIRQWLGEGGRTRAGRPVTRTFTFYDTHEWNLWFADRLLYETETGIEIASRGQGWIEEVLHRVPPAKTVPRFAAACEPGELRDLLTSHTGLRALCPVAELTVVERTLELLNQDGKIVFRMVLSDYIDAGHRRIPFLRLCRPLPLRGYDEEAAQALARMKDAGMCENVSGPLDQVLARQGRVPEPYTLRPSFALTPTMPAREAIRRIVDRMLALARSQEQGICDDVDTEFLHDYRICLRKIRSIITLLKDVLPPDETASVKRTCRDLAQLTNRLRDLDVYVLDREAYSQLVPESLGGGLNELFDAFQKERKAEFLRVRRHLGSAAYQKRIAKIEAFVEESDGYPATRHADLPIRALVSRRIRRRYRRILRAGRSVTADTPDAVMHDLRIECKKLRYLLELFREIYDPNEMAGLLKRLRRVQNRLGRFNDYAVQQKSLLRFWESLGPTVSPTLTLTIGGLVGRLYDEQGAERSRARKALHAFCSTPVRRRFHTMFKDEGA